MSSAWHWASLTQGVSLQTDVLTFPCKTFWYNAEFIVPSKVVIQKPPLIITLSSSWFTVEIKFLIECKFFNAKCNTSHWNQKDLFTVHKSFSQQSSGSSMESLETFRRTALSSWKAAAFSLLSCYAHHSVCFLDRLSFHSNSQIHTCFFCNFNTLLL